MEQFSEMKEFKVGSIVKGTVLRVTDNEVLVDIGYAFEGSIYKDHLSLNKVNNCHDFCKVGDEIEAKITKISHGDDKNILMLSRLDIEKKDIVNQFRYQLEIDKIVEAKVKKDIDAGLLLDFHGTEMFLQASLVDLQKIDPKTLLNKTVTVKVIDMREERGRMKVVVSRKQAQYDLLKQKEKSDRDERRSKEKAEFDTYTVGQVLPGTVTKLLDFGAVVQLGEMVDGLLHISEASHYHVKSIQELFTLGQVIDVQIIKITDKKLSLSVKSLQPTPWQLFMEKHQVGDKVTAVVVKKMQNGMLLEVEREVSGLISKFDYSWNINENLAGKVQLGEKVEVQITSIDPVKQQFTLSKKHLEYNPWADIHFQQGEHISGTVKTIQEKGAIIEVNGVEGYLPISELSDDRVEKVDSIIKVGEVHTLEVVECYPKEWKLKLSLRRVLQKESQKEYDAIKKDNVSGNQPLADLFSKFKK